ncbi:30S ribosomal protein S2 [Candidatus Woesebacteria bacterium RIFCSPHIGHO2_12_FULL_42_9]|uniref:Small ribosomal subunit protein uS2 n=1 Tax=Candidatus Woesebacteria bacterium RIFCSPHIGHO2_12_FULL_42_9 TaxID=1802511 RepID=A0A1F8AS81_9BACT|nr:MAG: 30S ribosomal protein S2 [Candidatus Woesebacteria bacterium RIFCSPHIGHO2_12_FULL_42_9]
MAIDISLKELLQSGAHFGHQARRWNPKMAPYLYGVEEGVHLFDLTKTKESLADALNFLSETAKSGKVILIVGTKKQAKDKVKEIALACGVPYVCERWLGGTLTNFEQINRSISRLKDLKEKMAAGEYAKFTKKERLLIERDIERMEKFLGGISELTGKPDVLFVVDAHKEIGAVKEAVKMGVTLVAIVDSNSDPTLVDYPIPMNDDAAKAIEYVLDLVKAAILEGKKAQGKEAKEADKKE